MGTEQYQDDEWSEQAWRLRGERELQDAERRKKAEARNRRRSGHRSNVHQQHVKSEVHDFEESLRLEDEIRDETNDYDRTGQIGDKQPKTRAERRKKRREDRERRRRERP